MTGRDDVLQIEGALMEVSDDISCFSLLIRLVNITALFKHYLPSPYPLFKLLSHIPVLVYNN